MKEGKGPQSVWAIVGVIVSLGWLMTIAFGSTTQGADEVSDLAIIRPGVKSGFSNAGWSYDRYKGENKVAS